MTKTEVLQKSISKRFQEIKDTATTANGAKAASLAKWILLRDLATTLYRESYSSCGICIYRDNDIDKSCSDCPADKICDNQVSYFGSLMIKTVAAADEVANKVSKIKREDL